MPPELTNSASTSAVVAPSSGYIDAKCHRNCKYILPCGHLLCLRCIDSISSPGGAIKGNIAYKGVCTTNLCGKTFDSVLVRDWKADNPRECGTHLSGIPPPPPPTPIDNQVVPGQAEQDDEDDSPLGPDEPLFTPVRKRVASQEEREESAKVNDGEDERAPSEPGSGYTTPQPQLTPVSSQRTGRRFPGSEPPSSTRRRAQVRARAGSISLSPSKATHLRQLLANSSVVSDMPPPSTPRRPVKVLKRTRSVSSAGSGYKPSKRRVSDIRPLTRESSFDMPDSSQQKDEAHQAVWGSEYAALNVPDRERGDSEDDGEYSIKSSSQRTIHSSQPQD